MPAFRRQRRSASKPKRRTDLAVFSILRGSSCGECSEALGRGQLLWKEGDLGLCMACAGLDHLVFLGRGNAALTRRARKYSRFSPVVVRFSRARKRYERQGVLVDEEALSRAEQECLPAHKSRLYAGLRAEWARENWDQAYFEDFVRQLAKLYPGCPRRAADKIARQACERHSRRSARTPSGKQPERPPVRQAVAAHVRNTATRYGELLVEGKTRIQARKLVKSEVSAVLDEWTRGSPEGSA